MCSDNWVSSGKGIAEDIAQEDREENDRNVVAKRSNVLLVLHGIRTKAEWQESIGSYIEKNSDYRVEAIKFGYNDLVKFIMPIPVKWRHYQEPVQRVLRSVRNEHNKPGVVGVALFAHSFGTFIACSIIAREPDVKLSKLFLCGGIVRNNFEWNKYIGRIGSQDTSEYSIVNDCGNLDKLPLLAKCFGVGYGSSGRVGFGHNNVVDRYFEYGHSDFFTEVNYQEYFGKYILPVLNFNQIQPGPESPRSSRLTSIARISKYVLPLILLSLLLMLFR